MERWQLAQRQSLPLEAKIELSKRRIREWYEHWDGQVYVAFSGGKDSTVLLHLAREVFPDIPAVFINTGLEYPEIVQHVKRTPGVTVLRPRKTFKAVIEEYGYPVVSKRIARYVRDVQKHSLNNAATVNLRLTGYNRRGVYCPSHVLPARWRFLIDAPFKVSEQCCEVMKKEPFRRFVRDTGRRPLIGMVAEESAGRTQDYLAHGCNALDLREPRSTPIAFWTEQDVLQYIAVLGLDYAQVYGSIVQDANGRWHTTGEQRTGCIFCMFGVHLEKPDNRFQRLYRTHPELWRYCMEKLGLAEVLDYIGIPRIPQQTLFDEAQHSTIGGSICGA